MAKPSKRPTREQRKRLSSTLADHKKEGRTLKPPFRTIENFRSVTWMKDTMPDMLWLCSIISTNGQMPGLLACTRLLDIVDEIAEPYISHLEERDKPVFDGRLTTFEWVPEAARATILQELEAQGLYELVVPEGFVHSLGLYPKAPGRWLIVRWLERGGYPSIGRVRSGTWHPFSSTRIMGKVRSRLTLNSSSFASISRRVRSDFPPMLRLVLSCFQGTRTACPRRS